jgi:hypothetical protein
MSWAQKYPQTKVQLETWSSQVLVAVVDGFELCENSFEELFPFLRVDILAKVVLKLAFREYNFARRMQRSRSELRLKQVPSLIIAIFASINKHLLSLSELQMLNMKQMTKSSGMCSENNLAAFCENT